MDTIINDYIEGSNIDASNYYDFLDMVDEFKYNELKEELNG